MSGESAFTPDPAELDKVGLAARSRYEHGRNLIDLESAIHSFEQAVQASPSDAPHLPRYLNHLGNSLWDRYSRAHDPSDLQRAIDSWLQAVRMTPPNSPDLPKFLNSLGFGYRDRYSLTRNLPDLYRTMEAYEAAILKTPSDSPDLDEYLSNLEQVIRACEQQVQGLPARSADLDSHMNNLGVGFANRHRQTGSSSFLRRALEAFQRAVAYADPSSPVLPAYLENLALALRETYRYSGDIGYLDQALAAWERVTEIAPADASLTGPHNHLGTGLAHRFTRTGDLADLEQAILFLRRAVDGLAPDSPDLDRYRQDLARGLNTLAIALADKSRRPSEDELERAVSLFEATLAKTLPGSSSVSMSLDTLRMALVQRFEQQGAVLTPAAHSFMRRRGGAQQLGDLDAELQLRSNALNELPKGPERAAVLYDTARLFSIRYTQVEDPADIDRAINLCQEAFAELPPHSPELPRLLTLLGSSLVDRYLLTQDMHDLEQIERVYTEALETAPAGSPYRAVSLVGVAQALKDRFQATGGTEDHLDRAIDAWRNVVREKIPNSMPVALDSLSLLLSSRYERRGDLRDLDEAIEILERPSETPPNPLRLVEQLNNLGTAHRGRYERTGNLEDLSRAEELFRTALRQAPVNYPESPTLLLNLGASLRARYVRSKNLEELNEAIATLDQAVSSVATGKSVRLNVINNLANGLADRFNRTRDPRDLDRAIDLLREAAEPGDTDIRSRMRFLNNLSMALRDRFKAVGDLGSLEEAIKRWEEVRSNSSPGWPEGPGVINNLANGLRDRYTATGDSRDLKRAIEAYRSCCAQGLELGAEATLTAARNWGEWASLRASWEEAVEAYRFGLEATAHLIRVQLARAHKEAWLQEARGIPVRAAYALSRSSNLPAAVVTFEQGRAVLLSEVLDRDRANLEHLMDEGRSDLKERYETAAGQLNALSRPLDHTLSRIGGETSMLTGQAPIEALRKARGDLDTAIYEIKRVPGYERFLDPPTFEDVMADADGVPLIYLGATEVGGFALVVRPDTRDLTTVWLPELTEDALREQVQAYWGAYASRRADRVAWRTALERTTLWLGQVAMGPVLEALGPAREAVLVPAGLLGLMPLHAAWTEDTSPTDQRYALDELLITYTPNARALGTAREVVRQSPPEAELSLLAVGEPRPVSAEPLSYAEAVVGMARAHFSRSEGFLHEAAIREDVLRALPHHQVLHFDCHGYANLTHALEGGLAMAGDHLLTLQDVFELRLVGARLAVLSACESAVPGAELPDEVLALPTGLIQAGVAGAVASLWSVVEVGTAMMMFRFYWGWRSRGLSPAEALRQAQRWLRDSTNDQKASYFEEFLSAETAAELSGPAWALYQAVVFADPGARDFAHPADWAAFAYIGV